MDNFKTLLKQEFLRHIHSFKFSLILIVSVIVTVVCVYVQIKDFEDRQQNYFEEVMKTEELKKSFLVFSEFKIPILIKPNPLSIFAKGFDEKIGNKIIISATEIPEFQTTSQKRNPFLDIFLNFDVISIVQIILSIMTVFLVADTISGEREDETLKLVFANHVSKLEYFLSKFIGSLFTLSIPLLFIFLVASIMIVLQPFISLSFLFWLKVFFIFICCLGFISIYILISLIVSAKTTSSSLSVIFGLLIWISLVSIYPNTIHYLVSETVSIPSADSVNDQIKQIEEQVAGECNRNLYNFPGAVSFSLMSSGDCYEGLPDIVGVTEKSTFEHIEKAVKENFPIIQEGLQKITNIKDDFRNRLFKQRKMASFFLKFLPGFMLEEASTKIANTDYWFREFALRSKARDFHQVVMDYLKSKDAFGLKFFTQMAREEMKDDYREYGGEIFEKYGDRDTYPRLNLNDIPVFAYSESIGFSIEILSIFILNILLFLVGAQFFSKADLRKRG